VRIFYCWQSDRPVDRNFIETALERAAREISTDEEVTVEPVVDRDTLGLPGSPDISQSIFEKIRSAAVVIADVTIVATAEGRTFCNPNVLVEVGYAYSAIAESRVILVMNTAHGDPTALPFDLRSRRVLHYHLAEDSDRAMVRRRLVAQFADAIRVVLGAMQNRPTLPNLRTIEIAINESMQNVERWLSTTQERRIMIGLPAPRLASLVLDVAVKHAAELSQELYESLSTAAVDLRRVDDYLALPSDDASIAWRWVGHGNSIIRAQNAIIALSEASRLLDSLKATLH
jgi:hypothetical protein